MNDGERNQQLRSVRRDGAIRAATGLGGLLLMGTLTLVLGLTTWRFTEQERLWAGEKQALKKRLVDKPRPVAPPITPETITQFEAAVNGLKMLISQQRTSLGNEGKLPPLDRLLEAWRQKVQAPSKPKDDPRLAELNTELGKVKQDAEGLNRKNMELTTERNQSRKDLAAKTKEAQDLDEKLTIETQRLKALTGKLPSGWVFDPSLATLVILVDAQTPLGEIVSGELLSLYSYHNTRSKDGEIFSIDVAQGGRLQQKKTSNQPPRRPEELDAIFPTLTASLEMQRASQPALEEIPRLFPSWFSVMKGKKIQIVLIAGGECDVPGGNAWNDVKVPVHVSIISDGRNLAPDFGTKWKKFTDLKSGKLLLLDVNFNSQVSRVQARAEFRFWMEDRMCLTSSSIR